MDRLNVSEADLEEVSDGVYLADFPTGEQASMKYWRIDPGATLPPHRHNNEQIGFLMEGELTAIVEDDEYLLSPGDAYLFAKNELHGAINHGEEPAIGFGVLSPPRKSPDWGTKAADPHVSADDYAADDD